MSAADRLALVGQLMPLLTKLGGALIDRFGGDVEKARAEIRRITNEGEAGYDRARLELDAEIEQQKKAGG